MKAKTPTFFADNNHCTACCKKSWHQGRETESAIYNIGFVKRETGYILNYLMQTAFIS